MCKRQPNAVFRRDCYPCRLLASVIVPLNPLRGTLGPYLDAARLVPLLRGQLLPIAWGVVKRVGVGKGPRLPADGALDGLKGPASECGFRR